MIKKILLILIVGVMVLQLSSCNPIEQDPDQSMLVQATVIEIEKYGHAVLNVTAADFMAVGYELGDIVCVRFGTREYTMPLFDGYYSNPGGLLLRASDAEECIAVCINYGDFSDVNGISVGDTVEITMSEKAGMLAIQELYALQYSNKREDYSDDASFANFRAVTAGRIGNGKLYRTASPINNENGRADYADDLIESVGVTTVLNLADSDEDIEGYLADSECDSEYYRHLYETGSVIAIDLTGNFYSEEFASSVAKGLTFLARNEAPYCIHCTEGKDRAGFTAMLLEALMGATLDEIISDYMISFYNYYGIDKEHEPKRYQAVLDINLMEMLFHITGAESVEQLEQINLETAVTAYLIEAGMSQEDIVMLKQKLE
mgnify:CR=1 FL=1